MKNVKYTNEKSRPNLFREVSGTMKAIITLLLVLFVSSSTFGQTIDWTNAPLNPVPVFYTANHYNLKGPIKEFKGESMTGESLYLQFNEQGKLVLKIVQGLAGTSKLKYVYQYDTKGNLISQTSSMLDKNGNASYESKADIKVDSKGLVTQLGGFIYSYDKNNRLVLCTAKDQNGKENYRQEFTYNNLGQVISEKITDPHVATGVMEVEEFKFAYTKRNTGGWDITMHVYKEGKLATKGSIPLITSSFVRQKREQIFNNPQNFSFDEIGLEAFKPDYVKVMIDQYNNLRGKFLIKMNKDAYPVNITYYKNELSIAKYKETTTAGANTSFQTTETRYYNGKYTKETALKKVNEYLKLSQDNRLKFVGGASSTYQIDGIWEQKINEKDKITVNIRYLIGDKSLSIKIISAVVAIDGNFIVLSPESTNEANRKAYDNQVNLFTKVPFDYLMINENITNPTQTTTTGSNTSFQTTETRYYNGKYTKETALKKVNEYITQLKNKGFNFTKVEGKSVYQFSGTWSLNNGANTTIEYVIGDNNLNVKLTKSTNKGMNITEIVRDEKHHLHGAVKALYDVEVLNYITKLFDYLQIKNNTTSNTSQTTTTAGSNTSKQTTETRYYNGKYTKETAMDKVKDFFYIYRTNGGKITFTKMEKKSDYHLIGNWAIKGADENLQFKIEYLFEDDALKIKINEIVLNDKYGALIMDKNHKDETLRKTAENLYTTVNDLIVKAVFVYLDINNNTTFKQTTTTAGANTAVKDYSKDKITASYNENESLYARKIDNATVYFYQNNKRINQPLHYAIIENDNNLRLFTTYTKDYYSAFALNDMLPEKLYPLTHRNGVFYLYINQSNGNFSFNYQGKALSSAQYELYKSKGDYTVVKVKSDNTIYLFKSDLTKAAISNSQSKGVLVHFADKSSIFVESGKPTEPTKWKIEKENDKYYLFNSSGSIKYSLSDYEKSINWGIHTIH